MPNKSDAQVRRTRQWMLESLLSLMEEKDFERITISELAQRADVDRRTFYRHYNSKEEIITARVRELAKVYETALRDGAATTTHAIALAFFRTCRENGELLMILHRHKLLPLLLDEFARLFPLIHTKYSTGDDPYAPFDMKYALSYHVGGFWNILAQWLADGMKRTPEELADIISHMLPEHI